MRGDFMFRVCFLLLPLVILVSACASQQPQATASLDMRLNNLETELNNPPGSSIFACAGIPAAGKKCGFGL
jgi:hypothetical protein